VPGRLPTARHKAGAIPLWAKEEAEKLVLTFQRTVDTTTITQDTLVTKHEYLSNPTPYSTVKKDVYIHKPSSQTCQQKPLEKTLIFVNITEISVL
jgi:hypothetical protein